MCVESFGHLIAGLLQTGSIAEFLRFPALLRLDESHLPEFGVEPSLADFER